MTTNGVLLDRLAKPLAEAGLDRVSVSCDSLMQHRFAEMTRRDALDRVLAGIEAAGDAGLLPIKINCVVIAGTNEDEVVDFAEWARTTGFEVRFIEYMPLDAEHHWERAKVVPSASILEAIGRARAYRGRVRLDRAQKEVAPLVERLAALPDPSRRRSTASPTAPPEPSA